MSTGFDDINNKHLVNLALPDQIDWHHQAEKFSMKAAEKKILLASMSFIVVLSWLSAVIVSFFSNRK